MGKNNRNGSGENRQSLGWTSRVLSGSPNAARVQQNLGVNFNNIANVTTAEVAASADELREAKRQKIRVQEFKKNQEKIITIRAEIEALTLELLSHGYKTDVQIEKLVQSGLKKSAQYQTAILLQQRKGELKVAETAAKHVLNMNLAAQNSVGAVQLATHKHGLSVQQITQSYAQKKLAASSNQQAQIAQSNQRRLEDAQFRAELKGTSAQPALSGAGFGAAGSGNNGGGFLSGIKQIFKF